MIRVYAALLSVSTLVAADPSLAGEGGAEVASRGHAIRAHRRFLADDLLRGRGTGSREYEIAARYVAARLEGLGLEPAGDDGTFLQTVPLRGARVDVHSARMEIRRGAEVTPLEWEKDFVMVGDPTRPEVAVAAPVVFVGHGVVAPDQSHDDYASVDVDGKMVLVVAGAPSSFPDTQLAYYSSTAVKVAEAGARGAVGILTVRSLEMAARYPWDSVTRNAGRESFRWLASDTRPQPDLPGVRGGALLSHGAATRLFEGAERSLEEALAAVAQGRAGSFGLPTEVALSSRSTHRDLGAPNVAGILRGGDPRLREEYVVYTAHLDHLGVGVPDGDDEIYNGAYDNAMGVSIVIEVARMLSEAARRPRRSMLFLFVAAEEAGLLGSEYFVQNPTVPIGDVVADVNVDMPLFLFPMAEVTAFGAQHTSLSGHVARAAEAAGVRVVPDPFPEEVVFIRSDQYAFVKRGVPAIMLAPGMVSADPAIDGRELTMEFITRRYHTPKDDLGEHVDWASAERFVLANYLLGLGVANAADRPSWNGGDFFGERFAR